MITAFRLQTVLDYRAHIVEKLEMALAALRAAERDAQTRLATLGAAQREVLEKMRAQQTGLLDLLSIEQLHRNWQFLKSQTEQQAERLAELREAVHTKREELLNAIQERDALLKLKERHAAAWQAEVGRRETTERDDQYIARAYHKGQG